MRPIGFHDDKEKDLTYLCEFGEIGRHICFKHRRFWRASSSLATRTNT